MKHKNKYNKNNKLKNNIKNYLKQINKKKNKYNINNKLKSNIKIFITNE